jgi:hypothetical protein
MSEQKNTIEAPAAAASQAGPAPAGQKPTHRAVSDPREVARVVVTRMAQVNAKKDELTQAINGLIDITQQLTRTYAQQLLAVEQLRRRVQALEGTAPAAGATVAAPSVQ